MKKSVKIKSTSKSKGLTYFIIGPCVITLIFLPDYYDPFNSPKLIVLLLLTVLLIGDLAATYFQTPVMRFERISVTLILGFGLTLIIATIRTDVWITGLIGDSQRRNGLLSYLCLIVVMLVASRKININSILYIYKAMIFLGLIMSVYGILQIFGKDFVNWDNQYNSMISTLGNPNFASAMLAIISMIAFSSFFIGVLNFYYKIIAFFVIILSIYAIISSNSKQGLLTLFFSLIFYFSILSYFKNKKFGVIVVGSGILIFAISILGMLQRGPLTSVMYKDSVSVRGYYWRAGLAMFEHSPFFGVGVDRYGAFFKQFREPNYPIRYGYEITSSNAHNTFIQMFATSGLLVGIFYLALQLWILIVGFKLISKTSGSDQKIVLGILASWVGFQAQSFISIDNIGISIWGWLLGGCILGLKYDLSVNNKSRNLNININKFRNNSNVIVLRQIFSILILIPTLLFTSKYIDAEKKLFMIKGIANPAYSGNGMATLSLTNEIMKNPFADPGYKLRASYALFTMGYTKEAFSNLKILSNRDPINPDIINSLALMHEAIGSKIEAISDRKKLANVDPWNLDNYLRLGILYKSLGKYDQMEEVKAKILSVDPSHSIAETAKKQLIR